MLDENDSCSVRSTGFTLSHLLPRMSTTTVKPRARTSSLMGESGGGGEDVRRRRSNGQKSPTAYADSPGYGRQVRDQSAEVFLLYSIVIGPGWEGQDWSATFVPPTWKTTGSDKVQRGEHGWKGACGVLLT